MVKPLAVALMILALGATSVVAQTPASPSSPPAASPPPYGPAITLEQAKKAVEAAEAEAQRNNWAVVIAVIDSGGNQVILHRLDNAQLAAIEASVAKAQTALSFKLPSKTLEDAVTAGGPGLRLVGVKGIFAVEGGIPILIDGKIVGAIGVSGGLSGQNSQVARAGIEGVAK
jgi:uncharacterized protein GlcG (DUF336 family)